MVAFGATLYATSVPGMIENGAASVAKLTYGVEGDQELPQTSESEGIETSFFTDVDTIISNFTNGSSSLGDGIIAITKSGLTVPALDLSRFDENDDQGSQEPEIPPSQEEQQPSDPAVSIKPEQPTEPEDSEEDKAIRAACVGFYNELPALYEEVSQAFSYFSDQYPVIGRNMANRNTVRNISYKIDDAWMEYFSKPGSGVYELNVPTDSKYRAKYDMLKKLKNDLEEAALEISNAWMFGPTRITLNESGQSTLLVDFVENYPGARP